MKLFFALIKHNTRPFHINTAYNLCNHCRRAAQNRGRKGFTVRCGSMEKIFPSCFESFEGRTIKQL